MSKVWEFIKKNKHHLLFSAFLLWSILLFFTHDVWRDEAQSYLIVRESSLSELFGILKIEGHPALWYLVLFPFIKLGAGVWVQGLISMIFAILSAGLVIYKSKFKFAYKVLFLYCTPMFFQYNAVARSYSLGMFLFVIATLLWSTRYVGKRYILWALLTVLMTNVSLTFAIMAGSLILADVIEAIITRRFKELIRSYKFWSILTSFIVGAIMMVLTIWSPSYLDEYYGSMGILTGMQFDFTCFGWLQSIANVFCVPFGSLPVFQRLSSLIVGVTLINGAISLCVVVLLVLTIKKFNQGRKYPYPLILATVFCGVLVVYNVFTAKLWVQHYSIIYLLVMAMFHMSFEKGVGLESDAVIGVKKTNKSFKLILVTLIALPLALSYSAFFAVEDVFSAYSCSTEAVEYIKQNGYDDEDTLLYSYDETYVTSILAQLDVIKSVKTPRGDTTYTNWQGLTIPTNSEIDYQAILDEYGDEYENIILVVYYKRVENPKNYGEIAGEIFPNKAHEIFTYGEFIPPECELLLSPSKSVTTVEEMYYLYKLK